MHVTHGYFPALGDDGGEREEEFTVEAGKEHHRKQEH